MLRELGRAREATVENWKERSVVNAPHPLLQGRRSPNGGHWLVHRLLVSL